MFLVAQVGAKARQEKLTPEQRREIARKAIRARWAKTKKKKTGKRRPEDPILTTWRPGAPYSAKKPRRRTCKTKPDRREIPPQD